LSPPLVITRDQADFLADTLEECLAQFPGHQPERGQG